MSESERRKVSEGVGWKVSRKAVDSREKVGGKLNSEELGKVWENDMEICQGCRSRVDMGQMGLECVGCNRWYHAKCEKLSKKEYDKICELEDKVMWSCGKCGDVLTMILQENGKLQKELAMVKQDIGKMREEMVAMKEKKISGMEEVGKIDERFQDRMQDIERGLKAKIEKCIEDITRTKKEQAKLKKEKDEMEAEVSNNLGELGKKIESSNWETKRDIYGKLESKVREFRNEKVESEDGKRCIASLREELEIIKEDDSKGSI